MAPTPPAQTPDPRDARGGRARTRPADSARELGLALTCDVIDLVHKPGSQRLVTHEVTSTKAVGDPIYAIAPGTPIRVNASLESVEEGIFVHGHASSVASAECSRCLDTLTQHIEVSFDELFSYPHKVPRGLEEDTAILEDDAVDLGLLVHDAFALAAPFAPLCRDDCPGLCAQCGFRMDNDPTHAHDVLDPRFAALASFFDDPGHRSLTRDAQEDT